MTAGETAINAFLRDRMRARKHGEIALTLDEASDGPAEAIDAALDDDLGDELLSLISTACHPLLSPESRALCGTMRRRRRREATSCSVLAS